jgi:hypothetical protein
MLKTTNEESATFVSPQCQSKMTILVWNFSFRVLILFRISCFGFRIFCMVSRSPRGEPEKTCMTLETRENGHAQACGGRGRRETNQDILLPKRRKKTCRMAKINLVPWLTWGVLTCLIPGRMPGMMSALNLPPRLNEATKP